MNKVKFFGILILFVIVLAFPLIYATCGYFFQYASVYPFFNMSFNQTSTGIVLFGDGGRMDGELQYKIDNEGKKVLFFFVQNNNHKLVKEVIVPNIEKYPGYQICYTNFMLMKHCIGIVK